MSLRLRNAWNFFMVVSFLCKEMTAHAKKKHRRRALRPPVLGSSERPWRKCGGNCCSAGSSSRLQCRFAPPASGRAPLCPLSTSWKQWLYYSNFQLFCQESPAARPCPAHPPGGDEKYWEIPRFFGLTDGACIDKIILITYVV